MKDRIQGNKGGQTRRLYYEDSHLREFSAAVIRREVLGDEYRIVLDQTAFFPEGGGQPADEGTLNGIPVTDVREEYGVIYHYTKSPVPGGDQVEGKIDWELRFDRMQQHTGEHIVSGLVHARFGYDNVGFHLGKDYCTMDFSGPVTKQEIREIEEEANRAVFMNLPVEALYPTEEEASGLDFRSKIEIEDQIRLIRIGDVDLCACCAPHVSLTGEIGVIKITNMINYKGGVRVFMCCGMRAVKDYQQKQDSVRKIGSILCEKEDAVADAVDKLYAKQGELKNRVTELEWKLLQFYAETIDVSSPVTIVFSETLKQNSAREFMNLLMDRGACVSAVFFGNDSDGYRYCIGSRQKDVREFQKLLSEKAGARGGGRQEMIQGSLSASEAEIRELFTI